MSTHSLRDDLNVLELGSEYLPRFYKDTTDEEIHDILENLKKIVREKRASLISRYQDGTMGDNEQKIKEVDRAAERILSL